MLVKVILTSVYLSLAKKVCNKGSKRCELSFDVRKLIMKLDCEGKSVGIIVNMVIKRKSTVQ